MSVHCSISSSTSNKCSGPKLRFWQGRGVLWSCNSGKPRVTSRRQCASQSDNITGHGVTCLVLILCRSEPLSFGASVVRSRCPSDSLPFRVSVLCPSESLPCPSDKVRVCHFQSYACGSVGRIISSFGVLRESWCATSSAPLV